MAESQLPAGSPGVYAEKPATGTATYRGWSIRFERPPVPFASMDWQATHPDYEADWDGESWTGSHPIAYGSTFEACCAEVDRLIDELGDGE